MNNTIFVSDDIVVANTPVLVIGLDKEAVCNHIEDKGIDIRDSILNINLKKYSSIDTLSEAKAIDAKPIRDWFEDQEGFLIDIENIIKGYHDIRLFQIVGDYRELCLVSVAKLLIDNNITPIIVNNNLYSISAKHSVAEGDTLENRIKEVNCAIGNLSIRRKN